VRTPVRKLCDILREGNGTSTTIQWAAILKVSTIMLSDTPTFETISQLRTHFQKLLATPLIYNDFVKQLAKTDLSEQCLNCRGLRLTLNLQTHKIAKTHTKTVWGPT